jgi:hypothetical protein
MNKDTFKNVLKSFANLHLPSGKPDVFLFSMPRSGSTWLMELIGTQPGFKTCSEPLNLRLPLVRKHLGLQSWEELHAPHAPEAMKRYFNGFRRGRLHFLDPIPFKNSVYHPYSNRIVFKILHGGEERIGWFQETFGGNIVYLIRHPIAVSLSREVYPRLKAYVNSDYRKQFTPAQLRYAHSIIEKGDKLEQGVLSWCLENAVPLRQARKDWMMLSYEQLVVQPDPVLELLTDRLELKAPDRMYKQLMVASAVKKKSDASTQKLLEQGEQASRLELVRKWRKKVTPDDEARVMAMLEIFGMDAYKVGEDLPSNALWVSAPNQNESREAVGGRQPFQANAL